MRRTASRNPGIALMLLAGAGCGNHRFCEGEGEPHHPVFTDTTSS